MRKINEIFYSLQGEGCNTGVPSVFIRFSGCNLKCGFCDTSHQDGIFMEDSEIAKEVNRYPGEWIILTGGEPSLFIDEDFIAYLKENTGKKIAIETNGTNPLPKGIDWVTLSPKSGMSKTGDAIVRISRADEIKVVEIGQDLEPYFKLNCVRPETVFLLQPCHVNDPEEREKNTRRTIQRVMENPRWRLSLQTHRLLNIP